MKIFVAPHVYKIGTPLLTALDNIGVEYTSSLEEKVDAVLIRDENETEIMEISQTYPELITQFGGDLMRFVSARNNLFDNGKLTWKNHLHESLVSQGLPSIDTILPTTAIEINDFFQKYDGGPVFCKAVLSKASMPNAYISNNPTENILVPDNTLHMSKSYDNLGKFLSSVGGFDKFLEIQNSDKALALHKCVLQADHGDIISFWVSGGVNGNKEYFFYPSIGNYRTSSRTQVGSGQGWLSSRLSEIPDDELSNRIRDPNNFNVDTFGQHESIKKLLNSCGVKHTFFTIQGFINDNNEIVIRDISLNPGSSHIFGNPPDVLEDQLKFVYGLQPSVTKHFDKYLAFISFSLVTGVFTREMVTEITKYKAVPVYVIENSVFANFCFIGDTKEEVISNIRKVDELYIQPHLL